MALSAASPFGNIPFASNSPRPSTQDINFVTQAAQSGLLEVQEGQLAQARASDPTVQGFGGRMVIDHTAQNATLSSLARQEGIPVPTSLSPQQQSEIFQLQSQNASAFDAIYLWGQIKDHAGTLMLFIQEAQTGQDPVIKGFAQNSLPILADHLRAAINLEQQHLGPALGQPALASNLQTPMSMLSAPETAMSQFSSLIPPFGL
jgi:putative membrane protein